VEDEYCQMSVDEIVNGSGEFPGLIPLVESYLGSVNVDVETRCELQRYLDLIRRRADGTLWTAARWIREFVKGHEGYKGDSVVGEEVNHDLIGAVIRIEQDGGVGVPNIEKLLGKQRQRGGQ
jgi:glutamate--cysteine ligase catalytic subunit